jgi:hypothetical protein
MENVNTKSDILVVIGAKVPGLDTWASVSGAGRLMF